MFPVKSIIISFLGLFFFTNSTLSQTIFDKLPFNIEVGVTKGEEIENRGKCLKEIKVKEGYFRCERYTMADKFMVFLSQNEIVNKVVFYGNLKHSFPRKWREKGLTLCKATIKGIKGRLYDKIDRIDVSEKGTDIDNFIKILKNDGIAYTVKALDPVNYFSHFFSRTIVTFYIDIHEFNVFFIDDYETSNLKLKKFYDKIKGQYYYNGQYFDYNHLLSEMIEESDDHGFKVLNEYCEKIEVGLVKLIVTESY